MTACQACGSALPAYAGTGRPRRWCSDKCARSPREITPEFLRTIEDRFWTKVDRSEDCWNWRASSGNLEGYGQFRTAHTQTRAHRASWLLAYGPIPDGLLVLHRCDNPRCVRPDHLFLGTNADNMRDRRAKGRYSRRNWDGPEKAA